MSSPQSVRSSVTLCRPDPGSTGITCNGVSTVAAILAWFGECLKGTPGSANAVRGTQPVCLSLTAIDSVMADSVVRGGTSVTIAADASGNTVNVGVDQSQSTTMTVLTVTGAPRVLGGIPLLDIVLGDVDTPANTDREHTIIFVDIGHKRFGSLTPWDLVDNPLAPLRAACARRMRITLSRYSVSW